MEITVNSKKIGRPVRFFTQGHYVFVDVNGRAGYLGAQLFYPVKNQPGLRTSAIFQGETEAEFRLFCHRYLRNHAAEIIG